MQHWRAPLVTIEVCHAHNAYLMHGSCTIIAEGRSVCMALAVAVRTGQDFDGADRVDADLGGFPQADAGPQAADRL